MTSVKATDPMAGLDPADVAAWEEYRAGDGPLPARYPGHAPMRGDDLDRDSHDGCDIRRWQQEGMSYPFHPRATTYIGQVMQDEAMGVTP